MFINVFIYFVYTKFKLCRIIPDNKNQRNNLPYIYYTMIDINN